MKYHITLFIAITFFNFSSYSEDNFLNDREAVRAILDSNGLFTVTYNEVSVLDSTPRIIELHLSQTEITSIPSEIGKLSALKVLTLGGNLDTLPIEFCNLTNLEKLNLSYSCILQTLPDSLGKLSKLHTISGGRIHILPNSAGDLTQLTLIEYCRIDSFPETMQYLKNLKTYRIIKDGMGMMGTIDTLSSSIGNLTSLTNLYPGRVRKLPESVGNLTNLEVLEVFDFKYSEEKQIFDSLPSGISNCKSLKKLIIRGHKMRKVPPYIYQLDSLKELILDNGRIERLPYGLKNLSSLSLAYNQIEEIEDSIIFMDSLKYIGLSNYDSDYEMAYFNNVNSISKISDSIVKTNINFFSVGLNHAC